MIKRLTFLLLVTLLSISCASRNALQQPSLSFDLNTQQNKVDSNGIEAMVKPIHSYADMKSYYDDDIIKYGVLPVQVYIKNKSNKPYLFSLDGINLLNSTGLRVPMLSTDQTYERIKKSQWRSAGWAAATGILALFSVHNVSEINDQIKADISGRILKGGNLIPGAATEGTLFYNVPPEISSIDNWKMSILLKDANGNLTTLTYLFSGNIEKHETDPKN